MHNDVVKYKNENNAMWFNSILLMAKLKVNLIFLSMI